MSDIVFTADFASTRQWVAGHSWACPDGGPVNPDDDKLDYLVPDHCRTGTFRAARRPDGRWNTGLLTTEDSADGFLLCAGDVLKTRARLPTQTGAWPGRRGLRDGVLGGTGTPTPWRPAHAAPWHPAPRRRSTPLAARLSKIRRAAAGRS
ncbi:hypothetical protein ACFY3M_33360 [Streptomyces mirabilis]|uniref:hypothetical protein n=1 Tax=Streptomyces mirabilis TaxID=68239 RepID=UPI003683B618